MGTGTRELEAHEKAPTFGADKKSVPRTKKKVSPRRMSSGRKAKQLEERPVAASKPGPSSRAPDDDAGDDDFYQAANLDDLFTHKPDDDEIDSGDIAVVHDAPIPPELVPVDVPVQDRGRLQPPDPDSLEQWAGLYYKLLVDGAPVKTEEAKRRDLLQFVNFFETAVGHDRIDGWTPAVTRHFQKQLRKTISLRTGRTYKPTTINRVMATVRHFGRWVHKKRPLLAGNPMEGVKDLVVDPPAWNGLSPRDVMRLKAACEQRLAACTRKSQNPLLEAAVFSVLLHTGLREHELTSLDLAQYHSKGFHEVPRKGKKITKKVRVPADARAWLERYLDEVRGREPGPLLLSRNGTRFQPKGIHRICQRIARQANTHLPEEEKIHLTPHMLRHTFLKRVADKHGIHVAQELSGNTSIREIFRYTKPSEAERDQHVEASSVLASHPPSPKPS